MSESRHAKAERLIIEAISRLEEEDFRFTVEVNKIPWEVYYVANLAGKPATIALRLAVVDGVKRPIIGAVGAGDWDEEKMATDLRRDDN